jgi:glycosyltransferase involved in cell wall biosynthesis
MKHSPRVLLCCEHYPPSVGGVQEVMRQIAERLAVRGYEVCVATGSHPRRPADTVVKGVRVVSFSIKGNLVKGMTGPVAEYQRFLKEGGFDSILIKAAQQWTFDAAVDVIPMLEARTVFIPCGFSGFLDQRYHDYFEKMSEWLRLFDQLVFYASDYQDINFARRQGLTNISLIPNGVDEREFTYHNDFGIRRRLGVPDGNNLLLCVGSRIMSKGHWEVLEAFRLARFDRPTTLVLNVSPASTGLLSSLKRATKHAVKGRWPLSWLASIVNKDQNKKVLITNLPRHDLLALYNAANLFVFASHVEYSPLVLFEASAAGLPFISSSAGNSTEIAKWIEGGTIVGPKSVGSAEVEPSTLARAIESLLSDPVSLKASGSMARRNIFQRGFVWERIIEKYIEVLAL